jgi:hypothetical protein
MLLGTAVDGGARIGMERDDRLTMTEQRRYFEIQ